MLSLLCLLLVPVVLTVVAWAVWLVASGVCVCFLMGSGAGCVVYSVVAFAVPCYPPCCCLVCMVRCFLLVVFLLGPCAGWVSFVVASGGGACCAPFCCLVCMVYYFLFDGCVCPCCVCF